MVNGETVTGLQRQRSVTSSSYSMMPHVGHDAGDGSDSYGAYDACDGGACCDGRLELLD